MVEDIKILSMYDPFRISLHILDLFVFIIPKVPTAKLLPK
jgi:hypothetical protein